MSGDIRKRWEEANIRMEAARLGCLGGCSGRLLLQHPPPGLSGDGARARSRSGVGVVGTAGLHLVDESFYGGKLLGQVAQVSFEGVELLVEVVESLRQRLDPEQEHREEGWVSIVYFLYSDGQFIAPLNFSFCGEMKESGVESSHRNLVSPSGWK